MRRLQRSVPPTSDPMLHGCGGRWTGTMRTRTAAAQGVKPESPRQRCWRLAGRAGKMAEQAMVLPVQ